MTGHFQTHCTHRVQSCSDVAELETRLLPASTLHKTSPLSTEYTAKVEGNMFYNTNLQFKYISLRGSELYSQVHILFY